MRRFSLPWRPIAALVALLAVGSGALLVGDGTPAIAAQTVNVAAGGGAAGIAVNVFRPKSVVINVGDTLNVTNDYEEPHTLTYVKNPKDIPSSVDALAVPIGSGAAFDGSKTISSGFIEKGGSYKVTFATGGAFHFICLIHPGMALDVTVVGAGVYTPPVDQAAAAATLKQGIAAGEAASAALNVPAPTKNANGTSNWTVLTGPSVPFQGSSVDVMRFFQPKINIGVGDTVVWQNNYAVPHTITFFPVSGPPPAEDQIDPFTATRATPVFDPSKYINSGIIAPPEVGQAFGLTTPSTFKLTFNTPGTYSYICLLHADQGMAGVIVVGAAGATTGGGGGAITPPNTGDAGLLGQSTNAWMIYGGVALLIASFVAAGGIAIVRRDS